MATVLIMVGVVLILVVVAVYLNLYNPVQDPHDPKHLEGKYSPNMNRFAPEKERKASAARTNLVVQLNNERTALAHKGAMESQAELAAVTQQTNIIEHETKQYELQGNQYLISKALDKNWDLATYLEIEKMTAANQLELDKQWQTAEQAMRAGFTYQLQAQQHLSLLTDYIHGLYEKSRDLKSKGKEREHKLIEEHITFMEQDFRGRQRLLQANNGQEIQRSDEDTNLR